MRIEEKLVGNFEKGRRGRKPIAIVIHTMVGSLEGTYAWFKNPESKVSSHYGIGLDGRCWQFVKEEDTAWHAGRVYTPIWKLYDGTNPNYYTIGIENEDNGQPEAERTEAQYQTNASLVVEICKRWDIPIDREHIVGHREIYAKKTCPGALDVDRIVSLAKKMANEISQPTLQWAVNLESFFLERQILPERREPEVRRWADESKILGGLISKWIQTLNLPSDAGLAQIEEHFSRLMDTEDKYVALKDAVESVVGHFDDDKNLIQSIKVIGDDLKSCSKRRDELEVENEILRKRRTLDRFTSKELVGEIFKRWFNRLKVGDKNDSH